MLAEKTLVIEPVTKEQIQPASVDIRLGNTFSVVDDTPSGIITLGSKIEYQTITADTYLILPGQFVLATTVEYFELPDDLTKYAIAIQCGGCMVTKRQLRNRVAQLSDAGVPVTNYGMAIAWLTGIFGRVTEIFCEK